MATDPSVPDERIEYRCDLRTGGWVGLTDDHLLVVDPDDDDVRVALDEVAQVTLQDFDWFVGVLSVALVGFGLFMTRQNALGGLAFAAFGAASLYWSYRKRQEVHVHVADRPKPITLYPAAADEFYETLGREIETTEAAADPA
jgi:hypothetical protein